MPEILVDKATPDELHRMLAAVVGYSKKSFVAMGKILRELKYENQFKKAIGAGIDTWEEYLRQPEIGLSTGEASRMISIYEEMVLRLGYDEETIARIPIKNVHYLLPLVKKINDKEDADELVADATLLSQSDFKKRLNEIRHEELGDAVTETHQFFIMDKILETGTLTKIMGIDSDTIKHTFNL